MDSIGNNNKMMELSTLEKHNLRQQVAMLIARRQMTIKSYSIKNRESPDLEGIKNAMVDIQREE